MQGLSKFFEQTYEDSYGGMIDMGKSNDGTSDWNDRISRKNKKAENRKNKKRINSQNIMERWSNNDSDDDLYQDREKFHK
jgi:hypothetical protein